MTVRWGILSTARINRLILAAAQKSDQVEVIAVASRDAGRAEAYARHHRIDRGYGTYQALLEDPDVEAVYISLPNSLHIEWALRALEARKHVLCEKPFSARPDEVEQAFDAAESAGLVLSEAFMFRHHPQTHVLARLVDEGAIGTLRLISAAFSFQLAAVHGADDARFRPELDGGSLMDVGSYCVNGIRFLAGEPERVYAEEVRGPSGVDVTFTATLSCPGAVLAHFDSGFVTPYRAQLEIVGESGVLLVDEPWQIQSPGIELRRDEKAERIHVEHADSYQVELENVSDAIRGDAPLLLGRDDAVAQARTLEALYRSASAGAPVELELPPVHAGERSAR
jgi:D-xylose 1-dehydrogenase (NADP+, D-xylono-1,5-lactone-forming)